MLHVLDAMGLLERSKWRTIQRICLLILLSGSFFVLNACSVLKIIQDEQQEADSSKVEEATLICSEECQDRGQCGLDELGSEFVLLAGSAPTLENHDQAYQANTPVTIVGKEDRSIIQVSSGVPVDAPFYNVVLPDGGQAWVAGWCLGY
jgi:hypothetical protein